MLADTERDGHRPAFNQTFREFGLPVEWSEEEYGRKLQIAGGKERMASVLTPEFVRADGPARRTPRARPPSSPSGTSARPQIYTEMVAAGRLPTRPGIRRIIAEAQDAGWTLAVASTSAEASVRAILDQAVGPERAARFDLVLAGDVVANKKPAPDIYLLALERLGGPRRGDARHRGLAQRAARRRWRGAALRHDGQRLHGRGGQQRSDPGRDSSLGDPGGERTRVIANRSAARPG